MRHFGNVCWLSLIAAATSNVAAAKVSSLSNSKLSIHANAPSLNATFWSWVSDVRPRVLKLLDPTTGVDTLAKTASAETILIGRIYTPAQPVTGDPAAQASAWFNASLPTLQSLPLMDYWEGYNEIDVHNVSLMAWYAAFEAERVALLASIGKKAAIGSFSTGTPDVTTPAIIQAFYPAIDAALAHGGILGLHEYSSPTLLGCFMNSTGQGWLTGRYRMLWQQYLLPTNRTIPIVISENGIDNSPCDNSPNLGGWQAYCSFWATQYNPPLPGPNASNDCPGQYVFQLAWYDSLLRADSYLLGSALFCFQCSGFDSYDLAPALQALAQYMKTG